MIIQTAKPITPARRRSKARQTLAEKRAAINELKHQEQKFRLIGRMANKAILLAQSKDDPTELLLGLHRIATLVKETGWHE
jgi:hypothetical protein